MPSRKTENTLGELLAFLIAEKSGKQLINIEILRLDNRQLRTIPQDIDEIQGSGNISNFVSYLPLHQCYSDSRYLEDNDEFFVRYIFVDPKEEKVINDCLRLSKHLNDCYQCFEIFSHVMREFYFKYQELSQNSELNKTEK